VSDSLQITRRVIINVDDLGLHPAVRRAVELCAEKGSVTSASVLANGPDLAQVQPIAGVSFGAHLNVLRGVPLSPAREIRSLVDSRGLFLGDFSRFATRVVTGAINRDELKLEWSRQVAHLRAHGLTLSHLDAEKHTHCFPQLFPIACEVAEEHGIRFVRRSTERYSSMRWGLGPLRRMLLNTMCSRVSCSATLQSADSVWGVSSQGRHFSLQAFMRDVHTKAAVDDVIEIVCHPGDVRSGDPALDERFGRMRVAELWASEFRALCDEPWLQALSARDWILTNFDCLLREDPDIHQDHEDHVGLRVHENE
jgi:predicted glycoside hydrolase/deacetylase ChbG (UPF0249 family)